MQVNLAPLVSLGLTFAATVLPVVAAAAAQAAVRHLGVQRNAALAGEIATAAKQAAGLAYHMLAVETGGVGDAEIHNVALARAVNAMSANAGPALAALGVTPDRAATMVKGELGQLLAAYPSVAIAAPVRAPTPSAGMAQPTGATG